MEDKWLREIETTFPVRKGKEEKQRFRQWIDEQAGKMGWKFRMEAVGRNGLQNLLIGDTERAPILITAHYDTGARWLWPDLQFPANPFWSVLWLAAQMAALMVIPAAMMLLAALTGCPSRICLGIFLLLYLTELLLMTRGPACRNNRNNDDAALAAVLTLLHKLPEADRNKCAFILFDGSETGRRGARAYARVHAEQRYTRLVLHLTHIGAGGTCVITAGKTIRRTAGWETLMRLLREACPDGLCLTDSRASMMPGDHRAFTCSAAVSTARRVPCIGLMIGRLHTNRDTVASPDHIRRITAAFCQWLAALNLKNAKKR